jgi:predicted small secreted protein
LGGLCYFVHVHMKSILLIAAMAVATVLSSCNTMIGIGRDMRIVGDGMEKSANKVKAGNSGNSGNSGSGDTSAAPVY